MAFHIYVFGIHAPKVAKTEGLTNPILSVPSSCKVKKIVGSWVNLLVLFEAGEAGQRRWETVVYNGMESDVVFEVDKADQVACSAFLTFFHCVPGEFHRLQDGESTPMRCANSHWVAQLQLQALAATDNKFYMVYNDGKYGELQVDAETDPDAPCPVYVIPTAIGGVAGKVQSLACGKNHILILTDTGTVLSHGLGSRGQLGHGSLEDVAEPRVVEALEGLAVSSIAAGGWHSAAATGEGVLYMWGANDSGQLGVARLQTEAGGGDSDTDGVNIADLPLAVASLDDLCVKIVACGSRHTAILADSRVFTTGWNKYGQLGVQDVPVRDNFAEMVLDVDPCETVCNLFCYNWCTVVVTEDKEEDEEEEDKEQHN